MSNPAEDMVSHIVGLVPGLTAGSNIFASRPRAPRGDVPQDAVFVYANPGSPPQRTMQQVDEIRWPAVVVVVRNSRQKTGSDLAQLIFNNLRGTLPTGYLDLATNYSSPLDGGYDSDGRHYFMINYSVPYLEP